MAQPNLESFTKRGMVMKEEVTEGTDSLPVGATDGIVLLDGSSGTEVGIAEKQVDRDFFTGNPFSVTTRNAFIEGDCELQPPVTPGDASDGIPNFDILLRTGGMARVLDDVAETTVYNMISTGIVSASAYFWHVDYVKKLLGSRTFITGLRYTIGEAPRFRARVFGSYEDVTTEAVPSITLPDGSPPALDADNGETLITVADASITDLLVWAKELSVDFGTDLTNKQYTSHEVNQISGRTPTFSLQIARTDLADFNPWAVRDAGQIIEANLTQDASATRYSRLSIRGQIQDIAEVDIEGDLGWTLTGPCIASNSGGDEIGLEFGVLP